LKQKSHLFFLFVFFFLFLTTLVQAVDEGDIEEKGKGVALEFAKLLDTAVEDT
jgi:hypothetical protein